MSKNYCRDSSFCIHPACSSVHIHSRHDRLKLYKIIEKTPEINNFIEEKTTKSPCKNGLRCNDVDCQLYHGFTYEARLILTTKFSL